MPGCEAFSASWRAFSAAVGLAPSAFFVCKQTPLELCGTDGRIREAQDYYERTSEASASAWAMHNASRKTRGGHLRLSTCSEVMKSSTCLEGGRVVLGLRLRKLSRLGRAFCRVCEDAVNVSESRGR